MTRTIVKSFVLTLLIAVSVCSQNRVQRVTMVSAQDTLPSTVTAYADSQVVRSVGKNLQLCTPVPTPNSVTSGYMPWVRFTVDSVYATGGYYELYAFRDSSGLNAYVAANHGIFQMTDSVAKKVIGSVKITMDKVGTWALGARKMYGEAQWQHPYDLSGLTNIYWLPVARQAWTHKASGVNEIAVYFEEK